eukprot:14056757-Alexandrium_andersonii.AAC.1
MRIVPSWAVLRSQTCADSRGRRALHGEPGLQPCVLEKGGSPLVADSRPSARRRPRRRQNGVAIQALANEP